MNNTVSIVTICFNNKEELLKTIQSVDSLTEKPYEHWIIDGSTTDDIRHYLQETNLPSYRKFLSEPDKGIADAFNKGIKCCTGAYILLLNSGDEIMGKDTISLVQTTFEQQPQIQWLHGKYIMSQAGTSMVWGKPFDPKKLYRGMRRVCHQTMYVKKSLYEKYGLYDEKEKMVMDYDFLCRIKDEPFAFVDVVLAKFAPNGLTENNTLVSLHNAQKVYEKYFGFSYKQYIWQWRLKILHYLLKTSLGKKLQKLKNTIGLENL